MTDIIPACPQDVEIQSCADGVFCRFRHGCPCTNVRIHICLRHLRTRCCVFIRISKSKFLHTGEIQIWTLCFECHPTVRCTRTQHCLADRQYLIPHSAFVSILQTNRLFSPGRSCCIGLFDMVWEELVELKCLEANCEMSMDVQLTEKIVPFIKGELAFRQQIGTLVFCTNIFDLDCEVQVDSVT